MGRQLFQLKRELVELRHERDAALQLFKKSQPNGGSETSPPNVPNSPRNAQGGSGEAASFCSDLSSCESRTSTVSTRAVNGEAAGGSGVVVPSAMMLVRGGRAVAVAAAELPRAVAVRGRGRGRNDRSRDDRARAALSSTSSSDDAELPSGDAAIEAVPHLTRLVHKLRDELHAHKSDATAAAATAEATRAELARELDAARARARDESASAAAALEDERAAGRDALLARDAEIDAAGGEAQVSEAAVPSGLRRRRGARSSRVRSRSLRSTCVCVCASSRACVCVCRRHCAWERGALSRASTVVATGTSSLAAVILLKSQQQHEPNLHRAACARTLPFWVVRRRVAGPRGRVPRAPDEAAP